MTQKNIGLKKIKNALIDKKNSYSIMATIQLVVQNNIKLINME